MAQKEAQDAKKQVKKLEAALEHEKQLKTEVTLTRIAAFLILCCTGYQQAGTSVVQ